MDEKAKQSNFVKYMSNPRSFTLKRWFVELLKEGYSPHDEVIERVATSLTTEKDIQQFGKLITAVYENAYRKAVEDYRAEAEKLGIKISVM
jgi:hypothetical protein